MTNRQIVYYDIILGLELVDGTYTEYVVGESVLYYRVPQEEHKTFHWYDNELSGYVSLVKSFEWSSWKKHDYLRINDITLVDSVYVKYSTIDKIVISKVPRLNDDFSLNYILKKLSYREAIEFLKDNNLYIQV